MDFEQKPRTVKPERDFVSRKRYKIAARDELVARYPHSLTFYLEPPTESISLKEFEEYAVARLSLLRAIERVNLTSKTKYSGEWKQEIQKELEKLQVKELLIAATDGQLGLATKEDMQNEEFMCSCRRYDHISHFILRLAYCRSDDLRKWFLAMEVDFFRFKFNYVTTLARKDFLDLYKLHFNVVDEATMKKYSNELSLSHPRYSKATAQDMNFYQVPFQYALDLVRNRRVFLKDGLAFVPYTEIITLIATKFRTSLSHCIALTKKGIPRIQEDERIYHILNDFDKRYTGKSFEIKKGKENSVSFQDLPAKSTNSFPLCMKELYDVVEREHHVKHFGRLQLGLFLKGIGLPMEEATKFWRFNFTKQAGMDGNRFDKQYLYNIRHMYGKEGKRADYTPYSCMKIIMSAVGTGDHHGCPFRHSDAVPLRSRLLAAKIPDNGIREILNLVQGKHFQVACQKYFEYTHSSGTVDGGIQHPNQYYEESENINLGRARKSRLAVPTTRVNVYESQSSSASRSNTEENPETPETSSASKSNMEDDIELDLE